MLGIVVALFYGFEQVLLQIHRVEGGVVQIDGASGLFPGWG
jgi:hypothetical protein